MQLRELLDELSEKLDMPLLRLGVEETLSLSFDDVAVTLEQRNESLLLISKLSALPKEQESHIYEFLLSMSVLGKLGVFVGMQEQNNLLSCVSRLDNYALNCDILEQHLENHVHVVEVLREAIAELQSAEVEYNTYSEQHSIRI